MGVDRLETSTQTAIAASSDPEAAVREEFSGLDAVIVLPTLNEREGIDRTLQDIPFDSLRAAGLRVRPLVVDGGSTDGTVEVARRHGVTVLRQKSRGKGGAMIEAMAWLRQHGVRYAVVLDADFTYPGEAIGPALCLLNAGSQLVVGIRMPVAAEGPGLRDMIHRVGNSFLNYLATQLSRHSILDLCSGFWGLDLNAGVDKNVESRGFEIEAELFLKSYLRGLRVSQIPIVYRTRIGEAKLHGLRDGARILLTIMRCARTRRAPSPAPEPPSDDLLRQILSIALLHRSNRMVVVAPPSRQEEARDVIEHLRGSGIAPHLVVNHAELPLSQVTSPRFSSTFASRDWATVVAMPSIDRTRENDGDRAVVLLPRTGRVVYVGDRTRGPVAGGRAGTPEAPFSMPTSGAYSLEFEPGPLSHLRWVTALGQQLDSSHAGQELTFLGANQSGGSFRVWRKPPSRDPELYDPRTPT